MAQKRLLRKGMTVEEVEEVLGDNGGEDHETGRGGSVWTFEFLVFDPDELMRLAMAVLTFRDGRLTRWEDEVELVAETWALIKAGDAPTLHFAGRTPTADAETQLQYVATLLARRPGSQLSPLAIEILRKRVGAAMGPRIQPRAR